jgi:CheY-like chemotaxis protein
MPDTRKRILIAEDSHNDRRMLDYHLKRIGHFDIREATNGESALASVSKKMPDLIFMDLQMPVMNGWEATGRIRQLPAGNCIPIVALGGWKMTGDEIRNTLEAGFNSYIAKPFSEQEVIRRIVRRLLAPLS